MTSIVSVYEELPPADDPTTLTDDSSRGGIDALRMEAHKLASQDSIPKADALRIMDLFHQVETVLLQERSMFEREIVLLKQQKENVVLENEVARLGRSLTLQSSRSHTSGH